ncbi:MAG: hypothetical protein ACR2MB_16805 [Acidimicrobiales bacterium]
MTNDITSLSPTRLYPVAQAGQHIGYGATRTRELIADGLLKAVMVDNVVRVPGWAIEEFSRTLPPCNPSV